MRCRQWQRTGLCFPLSSGHQAALPEALQNLCLQHKQCVSNLVFRIRGEAGGLLQGRHPWQLGCFPGVKQGQWQLTHCPCVSSVYAAVPEPCTSPWCCYMCSAVGASSAECVKMRCNERPVCNSLLARTVGQCCCAAALEEEGLCSMAGQSWWMLFSMQAFIACAWTDPAWRTTCICIMKNTSASSLHIPH